MFYVISNMNYSKHVCKTMLKALNSVHLFRINQNVKCDLTFIKYASQLLLEVLSGRNIRIATYRML